MLWNLFFNFGLHFGGELPSEPVILRLAVDAKQSCFAHPQVIAGKSRVCDCGDSVIRRYDHEKARWNTYPKEKCSLLCRGNHNAYLPIDCHG